LAPFFSFIVPYESSILGVLNLITVAALLAMIYYSARILLRMRLGRLEKGWKLVTEGLILLCAGFIFLTYEHTVLRASFPYFLIDLIGTVISLGGIILMVLGLRAHLIVWMKRPVAPRIQTENENLT